VAHAVEQGRTSSTSVPAPASGTLMRIYPERGLGMAIMANTTTPYGYHAWFERLATTDW
jgi:hypothetical protein